MMALLLHLMWGTPYIYQGEEIGMTNANYQSRAQYRDVDSLNAWAQMEAQGQEEAGILKKISYRSRDNARSPMQWSAQEGAGFTTGQPWIDLNPNYKTINVQMDRANPDGVFAFYQQLIALRKSKQTVVDGKFRLILPEHPEIFAYLREGVGESLLVICNFYGHRPVFFLPEALRSAGRRLILSNMKQPPAWTDSLQLAPYQALLYSLKT